MKRQGLLGVLMLLVACDDQATAIDPVWNKQPCAHCHMLVSDPRYAAEVVTRAGDRLYFDDVGCMASYLQESGAEAAEAWVRAGSHWLRARDARYATGADTPMGFGLATDPHGTLDFAAAQRAVAQKRQLGASR